MSGQWHPDAEALARYQAGRVRGFRDRRLAAHVASCARCASVTDQLAAVSTVLASVPAPPMPDAVERQITAAIAAEAAARQASPAASPASPAAAVPHKAAAPADGGSRPRRHSFRPVMAAVSAAACLLLVGFGYLLSQTGGSSSSSGAMSEASAPARAPMTSPEAAGRAPASAGKAKSPTDLVPGQAVAFRVVQSGTKYEQATLATQVGTELTRNGTSGGTSAGSGAGPTQAVPSGSASSEAAGSTGGSPPSRALIGCVSYLTGTTSPSLVDQATYQGKAVYVIADAGRAWVVGRGCTASNPELITMVRLTASG
jgi:hypothetical protein